MAKKVAGQLKLQVKAGSANPSPPIGPALGQRGINIMEFCKAFNAATQEMEKGMPIPVVITYYQDKSFTFAMKQPPVSYFLKKEAKIHVRLEDAGQGRDGRQAHQGSDQDDRRSQDEGSERSRYRRRNGHDRGLCPRHGPGSGGLRSWQSLQSASRRSTKALIPTKLYALYEAISMVKERAIAKFDETIEVAMNLGVDPRHADQMVRGVVNLPNGTGRDGSRRRFRPWRQG